jgi:hypothetical protein
MQLCQHEFQYVKQYAQGAPKKMPVMSLVAGAIKKAGSDLLGMAKASGVHAACMM